MMNIEFVKYVVKSLKQINTVKQKLVQEVVQINLEN